MRYYYPPTTGVDLSKGFETFDHFDDTEDEHLDGLLGTIIDLEERTGTRCAADIITWRGMMTKASPCEVHQTNQSLLIRDQIMATPYDDSGG